MNGFGTHGLRHVIWAVISNLWLRRPGFTWRRTDWGRGWGGRPYYVVTWN